MMMMLYKLDFISYTNENLEGGGGGLLKNKIKRRFMEQVSQLFQGFFF